MEFDRWLTVLWTGVLLSITPAQPSAPIIDRGMCLSQAGAILDVPAAAYCQPLGECPSNHHRYEELHKQCRTNDTARTAVRESFLFQVKYWQGDHVYMLELLRKSFAKHALVLTGQQTIEQDLRLEKELQRKLLIYSIEAGRVEDAIVLYLTMKEQPSAKQIMQDIATNSVLHEMILEHLLTFVRALPIYHVRKEMYKEMHPLLDRNRLKFSYTVLLYGADSYSYFPEKDEKQKYPTLAVTNKVTELRQQLVNTRYDENLWIARHYPRYYTFYIEIITGRFIPKTWERMEKKRFFEFASMLTTKTHRFVVIDQSMKLYEKNDYQHSRNWELLPTLANEVDKLEKEVKRTGNDKTELANIEKLKTRFHFGSWFARRYSSYLINFRTTGKGGQQNKELEKMG